MLGIMSLQGNLNFISTAIYNNFLKVFESECQVLDAADNYLWNKIPEIAPGPDPGPNPGPGPGGFECGFALEFTGFDADSKLNGLWFIGKDSDGKRIENAGFPGSFLGTI